MRGVEIHEFGGTEVLTVRDLPDPAPPRDGYVVRVVAAGLNFADVVERRGRYRRDQALPARLGKEAAGVVVACGSDATEFDVGDAVIVVKFGSGCHAELVRAGPDEVLRPPAGYTYEQMAAFGITFVTAWYSMHEIARVRPGESVLVQAAAGGVGTAAVALARSHGCKPVIGTAGGEAKCALVRDLGADVCVDYRAGGSAGDFLEVVRDLTDGAGVDYCLESVGGEVYGRSLEALAPMGRMVIVGFSSISSGYADEIARLHPLTLFHRSITVGGLNIDNLAVHRRRGIWRALVDHVEDHGLVPVVGPVFGLDDVAAAHDALEQRTSTGKVVLRLAPDPT